MRAKVGMAAGMAVAAVMLVAFKSAPDTSREVHRIQAHFDSVLVELRAREVSSLTIGQRTRRSLIIDTLMAYRNRGVFPRNYDFAEPTPYFIDRRTGVLCAVAHLLASTGRRDIVDRVASADNNVWVPQLAGDAEFERWLDVNGITLAEAARIQVPYIGGGTEVNARAQSRSRVAALPVATASLATATGAANLLFNRDGGSRLGNVLGLASGATSLGVGLAMLRSSDDRGMAIANASLGTISAFLSARGMQRHRQALAAERESMRARVAVAPLIPTSETGAGVSVNVRF